MSYTETMRNIEGLLTRWEDREAKAAIERAKFHAELEAWKKENRAPIELLPVSKRAAKVTEIERRMIAKLRAEKWTYAKISEIMGRTEASCRIIMYGLRARRPQASRCAAR